jgi:hypothetical protein
MRSVDLLKIALEAELLRLRAMLARQGRRAAFAFAGLVFALAVLACAELAGWQGLRLRVEAIPATLILLGINLVIAAVFGLLAARSSPGHAEREALRVRQQALNEDRAPAVLRLSHQYAAISRGVSDKRLFYGLRVAGGKV